MISNLGEEYRIAFNLGWKKMKKLIRVSHVKNEVYIERRHVTCICFVD